MIERQIEIATAAGRMNTFICHPEKNGPHPVVILYMDAPGIREELRDMARRLGTVGYYVMLPNMYYRSNVETVGSLSGDAAVETRKRMFELMETLTIAKVMDDTDALLAFAGADAAASKGPIGTVGYCMSGQFALGATVRYPARVTAAASIYGTRLVTDQPDSPHLTAPHTKAAMYVAFAEHDSYVPLPMAEQFTQALQAGGANAEVELFKGCDHGFAFPQRPAYNKAAAEKHWESLFALFGKQLKA
jgi:carboxymethylenebutenolidase